jgi:hypothetical protein
MFGSSGHRRIDLEAVVLEIRGRVREPALSRLLA